MKKLITGFGWLLVVPFLVGLAAEIFILGKIIFVDGYNQDQMGSEELAYGGLFLALAGVVALVGVVLIRRGRDQSVFIAAGSGAGLGLVAGLALGGGLIVAVIAVIGGSALGGLMGSRRRRQPAETAGG